MMSTEPIVENVAEIVGEVPLPCYYADWSKCGPNQARWVMHVRCPECGCSVRRLACGPCKVILETSEAGVTCPACDEFTAPARYIFTLIEWLQ